MIHGEPPVPSDLDAEGVSLWHRALGHILPPWRLSRRTRARASSLLGVLGGLHLGCAPPCPVRQGPFVPHMVKVAPDRGIGFPFEYLDDYDPPEYTDFRAEGRGIVGSLPCAGDYIQKYFHKKLGAPSAQVEYFKSQSAITKKLREEAASAGVPKESATIGFVGDIMWIRTNWDGFVGDDVRRAMDTADGWFGNLETVISKSHRVPSLFSDYPNYNSAPGLVRSFRRADNSSYFKVLSFANNHSLDFGEDGARETLAFLDEEGILHHGIADKVGPRSYIGVDIKGIKIGFYAATWGMNRMSLLKTSPMHINVIGGFAPRGTIEDVEISGITRALTEMNEDRVDFKIISLHWGFEFEMYPDPLQMVVAREIVKQGADVIMGHHPHVEQPMEVCFVNGESGAPCHVVDGLGKARKALILYSLGNFTTAKFTRACQLAPMHKISVTKSAKGEVTWDFAGSFTALNEPDYGKKRNHHLSIVP